MLARQCWQESGDHLDRPVLEAGFVEKLRLFGNAFDGFPFQIPFRVVEVGGSFVVGARGQAAGLEHLHHQRSARARQAADDEKSSPGIFRRCLRAGKRARLCGEPFAFLARRDGRDRAEGLRARTLLGLVPGALATEPLRFVAVGAGQKAVGAFRGIDRRQPAVRVDQARAHAHRAAQGDERVVKAFFPRETNAQIQMGARQIVEPLDGLERRVDGGGVLASAEVDGGQTLERCGRVGVEFHRAAQGKLGRVERAQLQPEQAALDPHGRKAQHAVHRVAQIAGGALAVAVAQPRFHQHLPDDQRRVGVRVVGRIGAVEQVLRGAVVAGFQIRVGQLMKVARLPGVPGHQVFQQGDRFLGPVGGKIDRGQVVAVFVFGAFAGFLAVRAGVVDVAERGELAHQFVGRLGRFVVLSLKSRRMAAVAAGHAVPGRDRRGRLGVFQGFEQRLAVHVAADGQTGEGQQRRRDVEQTGAVDALIALHARSAHDEHAKLAMPEHRTGRLAGMRDGPRRSALETVVGTEHDGRLGAGELEQPAEQEIVETIDAFHHAAVDREVALRDVFLARRVIRHEGVGKMVDGVEIHRCEIPRRALHQRGGDRLHAAAIAHHGGEWLKPAVFLLIDLRAARNERQHHFFADFFDLHPQRRQLAREARRMDGVRRHAPTLRRLAGAEKQIGNRRAVQRLGRVARPPGHHVAAPAERLLKNVPERLGAPRSGGEGAGAAVPRIALREAVNAVLVRQLAGRDGGPEHRRDDRMQGGEISHHAAVDQALEHGHFSLFQEWVDHLPVGGIPADEQEAFERRRKRRRGRHKNGTSAGWRWGRMAVPAAVRCQGSSAGASCISGACRQ